MVWISPSFRDDHFRWPLSLDDKITVFVDRVRGWQLQVAKEVAEQVPRSGHAVLSIIMSYFEMYAKFEAGFTRMGSSKEYSLRGIEAVLGEFYPAPRGDPATGRRAATRLYEDVRCGLYHAGLSQGQVWLADEPMGTRPIMWVNQAVNINPRQLVEHVRIHLESYVARLQDPSEVELRHNFEARFDFDSQFAVIVI